MSASPGRARLAAQILVETWQALGSDPATYDLVWRAKEYLHDAAEDIADWLNLTAPTGGK